MKVLELKGYKSLRAFNAYHALLLGLKMLPAYFQESYEDFLGRVKLMPPEDQEKIIREATWFVELKKDEVEALICFCTDKNGVPYHAANLGNLGPEEIVECVVAVCKEIAKIKIDLVTEDEKKKLAIAQ